MKLPNHLRAVARFLLLFVAFCSTAFAQTPPATGTLTVRVIGLKTTSGKIIVNLFRKDDDLFGKPYLQHTVVPTQLSVALEFAGLPFATYVGFAFQDENDNGTLDHNLLHIPKEPMGYTNDWHFGLFTGLPSFEKTKFTFAREDSTVTITVR